MVRWKSDKGTIFFWISYKTHHRECIQRVGSIFYCLHILSWRFYDRAKNFSRFSLSLKAHEQTTVSTARGVLAFIVWDSFHARDYEITTLLQFANLSNAAFSWFSTMALFKLLLKDSQTCTWNRCINEWPLKLYVK